MSIDINVETTRDVFYLEFKGIITLEDVKLGVEKIYSNKHIYGKTYQIIDFTKATTITLSGDDVKEVVLMNRVGLTLNPKFKLAIIAHTDLFFGITRMYRAYVESLGFNLTIFRDREQCELWINNELAKDTEL